jgi:hypothetical protein
MEQESTVKSSNVGLCDSEARPIRLIELLRECFDVSTCGDVLLLSEELQFRAVLEFMDAIPI